MGNERFESRPDKTALPIVGEHVKDAILAEMKESSSEFFHDIYRRMFEVQPALVDQMTGYIEISASGREEQHRMLEVLILTYRMLEAQGEADLLEQQVNG